MKLRISKKLETRIPLAVASAIRAIQASHPSIKSFTVQLKPEGFVYTAGEGETITAVYADTIAPAVEMVADHTMGASNVNHGIGATARFPAGTFLIVVGYYCGYHLTVYNITEKALP